MPSVRLSVPSFARRCGGFAAAGPADRKYRSKLHIINLNLLPNSVLKNPFYDFHSMFQENPVKILLFR